MVTLGVLGVAIIPMAFAARRLTKDDPRYRGPLVLPGIVAWIPVYAFAMFLAMAVTFRGGTVVERNGRYFQHPWAGENNEWEVKAADYERYRTYQALAGSAFIASMYLAFILGMGRGDV